LSVSKERYAGTLGTVEVGRLSVTVWVKERGGSRYYYGLVWIRGTLSRPGRRLTVYLDQSDVNALAGLLVAKTSVEWGIAKRVARAVAGLLERVPEWVGEEDVPWWLWYGTKERVVKTNAEVLARDVPRELRDAANGGLGKALGLLRAAEEKLRAGSAGEALALVERVIKVLAGLKKRLLELAEDAEVAGNIASRVMAKHPYELCSLLP